MYDSSLSIKNLLSGNNRVYRRRHRLMHPCPPATPQRFFITLERPIRRSDLPKPCSGPLLIECISKNAPHHQIYNADLLQELEAVRQPPCTMVRVHHEVGPGVITDPPGPTLCRSFQQVCATYGSILCIIFL